MFRSAKFWVPMMVFQIAFGYTIFAITRDYYTQDTAPVSASLETQSPHPAEWPQNNGGSELEQLISTFPGQSDISDPLLLAAQADELFMNQQYDRAANSYQRLLAIDPQNVDTYNNLGITLFYLGRSDEAVQILNDGIALDPSYQRIWLTTGFVNSQVGHITQARTALKKAVQLDADSEVGRSAAEMLRSMGPG